MSRFMVYLWIQKISIDSFIKIRYYKVDASSKTRSALPT